MTPGAGGGSRYATFLAIAVSLVAAIGAAAGFVAGRRSDHDSFALKVAPVTAAQNTMLTLYAALGAQLDDPPTALALAKLYGVPAGDRDALAARLRTVPWVPAHRPAPFVGHLARPMLGDDPHINVLGFRDRRSGYSSKPERTVRVFITGGSTAWGSGAPSQDQTISSVLERDLNARISPLTGYRYEIVNTAFPAWTTTQEKLLIQQRLVDMHPDAVLMFSGTNDIHWSRAGHDIRWFYGPEDENYLMLLNELYTSGGHPEWTVADPAVSRPMECADVARITARNVEDAAFAASGAGARLIFALQPNVATTAKRLTKREQQLPEAQNRPYWESCYRALRERLGQVRARNYRLIDLSRALGQVDGDTEVFVDSYHFAGLGNRLIAKAIADAVDWRSIRPSAAVKPDPGHALQIVTFSPADAVAGRPLSGPDGSAAMRIVPNRFDKNLLVVFDATVLPALVESDRVTVSIPAPLYAASGAHRIAIVDGMTGEMSAPVVFQAR